MVDRLKVGVVGLGFMGRYHIANYEQMTNVQVVAIADADPQRLNNVAAVSANIALPAPKTDFAALQRFEDGRTLIAEADVDFVDICLPTYLHAEFAVLAAQRGRHVIVEKPMALSSTEAARMIESAHRNGVELMVAQCVRFWPEFVFLKETLTSGRLGRLLRADFTRRSSQPIWSWQGWMRDHTRSGGAIFDLHIHDVDFVYYLLGLPHQLYAVGVRTAVTGAYDLVSASYTYRGGPVVVIDGAWYEAPAYGFGATYQAVFERGMVRYDGRNRPTLTVLHNDTKELETPQVTGDAYYNELALFVNCLADGRSPASFLPPESSQQSLRLIEHEIRSIESGAPVGLA